MRVTQFIARYYRLGFLVFLLLCSTSFFSCIDETPFKNTRSIKESRVSFGITKSKSNSKLTDEISFQREATYGSTEDVLIGEFGPVAVDNKNRVFIGDVNQTTFHIFNSDGRYIRSIGREGRGPGDYSAITSNTTIEIQSNRLFITDTQRFFPHGVNVYSLEDFSLLSTIKLIAENRKKYEELEGYYPKRIFPRTDGTFLVPYHRTPHEYKDDISFIRYVIQDSYGNIISEPILELKDRTNLTYVVEGEYSYLAIRSFPFFGKSLLAISENDHLYVARSEKFEIDVYDPNGDFIRTFGHPFNNRIFNKNNILDYYKETNYGSTLGDGVALEMIREAENLPETWPAIEEMFFDDENRFWVSTIIDSSEMYEWWILKNTGEVIVKFKWPRDKPIQQIRNGYLYTKEKSEENADIVVKYKIEFKEKE